MTPSKYTIDPARLAALLAKRRGEVQKEIESPVSPELSVEEPTETIISQEVNSILKDDINIGIGRTGESITYNSRQLEAITRGGNGESIVVIGAAGTGKTTCMQGVMTRRIQSGAAGILEADGHKYLPATGAPGIVVVAFTRRAVNNIRRFMPDNMKANCITIHKLLEYEPIFYEVMDPVTNEMRNTMRFEPTRNRMNPLPRSIHTIVFEESSMVDIPLYTQVMDAMPHSPQQIFLGDIQQLPPVFGSAILGYKMLELPVIELTEVYRQALESPIIRLAHRILSGIPINFQRNTKGFEANQHIQKTWESWISWHPEDMGYEDWKVPNKLTIHHWKKKLKDDIALLTAAKFFTTALDSGIYNHDEDMILIPFNKAFGTADLNKHIAQHLARKEKKVVWEIIAGFQKVYLSVGDKVLVDKEDAVVLEIVRNASYTGKKPQHESTYLDYWGHNQEEGDISVDATPMSEEDIDILMASVAAADEDRVNVASHIVKVRLLDSEREVDIESAGAVNQMILSYALTVHKSQGSEWRKVFCVFHQSHATMLQRELLYTAVTRAKEELYVICEPETFSKGILSQRIKGNTLAEKAEFFKGKINNGDLVNAMEKKSPMGMVVDTAEPFMARIADKLCDIYALLSEEEKKKQSPPLVTYEKSGSSAGQAYYLSNRININPIYLASNPERTINITLPHELAHLCSWNIYKQRGHEYWWAHYCKVFGIPAEQFHYEGRMGKNIGKVMARDVTDSDTDIDIEKD